MFLPILVFKAGNQHATCVLAGGVYKLVIIDVNADMRVGVAVGIEKNQIAGNNLIFRDL